jgi:hypothetical protein
MNIKPISLVLIMLAFLAGSFVSVLDPVEVEWAWLAPILLAGSVGLFLFRRARHGEASAGHRLTGDMTVLGESLARILANLEELCEDKADLPVYEARFEIDRRFREDLNRFANARETMIHVFGMQGYANVMSAFAAGERYINRVWSASTDGYLEEVQQYLEKARNQFVEANGLFRQLRAAADSEAAPVRAENI